MGYEKDSGGVWWKDETTKADALMQKVCSRTIDGLDGLLDTLVLSDVIENRAGLLSLVSADTPITQLDTKFQTMFTSTEDGVGVTIGQLKKKGLVPGSINPAFDNVTFAAFMELAAGKVTPDLLDP